MEGQRFGYRLVWGFENEAGERLENLRVDAVFEDRAKGRGVEHPELDRVLGRIGEGDTILCESMDRLGRNVGELRSIVHSAVKRGARIEFLREALTFGGGEDAESQLLLRVMGAFADFERTVLVKRRRAGILLAKGQGKYKGRKAKLSAEEAEELRRRARAGESKTALAKAFAISRQTLYVYLRRGHGAEKLYAPGLRA